MEAAEKAEERSSRPTSVIGVLLETGLAAMHQPASVLLPLTALVYSLRVVALSFEIVLASKAAFIQANWARESQPILSWSPRDPETDVQHLSSILQFN